VRGDAAERGSRVKSFGKVKVMTTAPDLKKKESCLPWNSPGLQGECDDILMVHRREADKNE